MSEPTYTFTLTETERVAWAKILGGFVAKLVAAPIQIDSPPARPAAPSSGTDSARAILSPPAAAQSAPTASPIALRDRWARDRKGNEVPNPDGCYTVSVQIFKAQRQDVKSTGTARMKVAFDSPTGQGSVDAACFDEKLFPFLAAASKEARATLHIVKNGKYLNVIGIRA